MSRDIEQGKEGIFGHGLPGTGGDLVPTDVDQDVEGHKFRKFSDDGPEPGSEETEADVEGHLYTGGPRTQGEFTRRGPGENPHGER